MPTPSKAVYTDHSVGNPWGLTPAEFHAVELMMTLDSLQEVADACGVKVSTTETQVFRAYKKLGVRSMGRATSKITLFLCRSNPGCGHGVKTLPSLDPF